MVVPGTFILASGEFGFNQARSLGQRHAYRPDCRHTMWLGRPASSVSYVLLQRAIRLEDRSSILLWKRHALAGLVAITAPAGFVTAPAAVFIGIVAGCSVVT